MDEIMETQEKQNSSLELLKIIAMILIVTSHVTQTMYSINPLYSTEYVVDITHAATNIQNLILTWMATSGSQGNAIFLSVQHGSCLIAKN